MLQTIRFGNITKYTKAQAESSADKAKPFSHQEIASLGRYLHDQYQAHAEDYRVIIPSDQNASAPQSVMVIDNLGTPDLKEYLPLESNTPEAAQTFFQGKKQETAFVGFIPSMRYPNSIRVIDKDNNPFYPGIAPVESGVNPVTQIQALRSQLKVLEVRYDSLKASHDELNGDKERLVQENRALRSSNQRLQAQLFQYKALETPD